jgi:hypothetical protein
MGFRRFGCRIPSTVEGTGLALPTRGARLMSAELIGDAHVNSVRPQATPQSSSPQLDSATDGPPCVPSAPSQSDRRPRPLSLYSAMRDGEIFVLDMRPRVSYFRIAFDSALPSLLFQLPIRCRLLSLHLAIIGSLVVDAKLRIRKRSDCQSSCTAKMIGLILHLAKLPDLTALGQVLPPVIMNF